MMRLSHLLLLFCWVVACSGLLFERPAIAIPQQRSDLSKLRIPSQHSKSNQHQSFLASRRSTTVGVGSPLFSKPSSHNDTPYNNPTNRGFFSRLWLKLSALVATVMLVMSLFLTPASAGANGKYEVSFWTPEMDATTTTTSRVVPTPSSTTITSTSADTPALALDSPILSETLTRWEPFEDGTVSTGSTTLQQSAQRQSNIQAGLDYGMILTNSHGWKTKTIVSAIQLSLLSTLVVTAVIMGKEDLAFRLRQRAFLTSTFGPASRRKQPTLSSWSSVSRRRASTSLALILDGWKRSTTALRKKMLKIKQPTVQDKDREDIDVLEPEEKSPTTEIFTIVDDDDKVEERPNILNYDTLDALLMDGKVIPVEPLLLGDVYERNIQDDKIQKLKKTKLRRNNNYLTSTNDGGNPVAFYDRLMVQAALERAEEEARKEEESKRGFGLRRSGHGAQSRQALAKARPTVAFFRNGTTSMNARVFGLQKSSRNHTHDDNRQ